MARLAPSLIARLRRRLATTARLFALLVLAKAMFATTCLADEVTISTGAETIGIVDRAIAQAALIAGDEGSCWHGDSAGCHCACAHSTALAVHATTVASTSLSPTPLPSIHPLSLSAPRSATLRPPIA